ncbi:MAG: hypothetical protein ACKKL4_03070 [Patescibacteria group bacterium]
MSKSPEGFIPHPRKQNNEEQKPKLYGKGSERELWSLKSKQPLYGAARKSALDRADRENEEAQKKYREGIEHTEGEETQHIKEESAPYVLSPEQRVDAHSKTEELPEITELARASRKAQEAYDAQVRAYYTNKGALRSLTGGVRKFFAGDELPKEIIDLRAKYHDIEKQRREAVARHIRDRGKRKTANYEQSRLKSSNDGIIDIIKRYDYRSEYRSAYSAEIGKQANERIDMKLIDAYQRINPALRRGMSYGALTGLAVAGGAPLVGAAALIAARMGGGMAGGVVGAFLAGRINKKRLESLNAEQRQELSILRESYERSVEEISHIYKSQKSKLSLQEERNMRRQIGFAVIGGLVGGAGAGFSAHTAHIEQAFDSTQTNTPSDGMAPRRGSYEPILRTNPHPELDTTPAEQARALGYTTYAPRDTVYDIAHQKVVDASPEMAHLSSYERDNLVMNFIEKLRQDPELSMALTGSYSPDYIQAGDEVRLDSWRQLMSEESGSIKNRYFDWELDRVGDAHGNFRSMLEAADALDPSTTAQGQVIESVASREYTSPLTEYRVQRGDNLWNLWGEYATSPITDAQKVAMEAMVRDNPGAFGIDSNNPDLIYTGEDINLQAMFDTAQERGIIPAEANPAGEALDTSKNLAEMRGESAGEMEQLIEEDSIEDTKAELDAIRAELADMAQDVRDYIEGGGDGALGTEAVLSGTPQEMASEMEAYLQDGSQLMSYEYARPYFDTVLASGSYDLIKQNILENFGGEEVYVKAIGIDPETGHKIVDFTNINDPINGTYFRYDLESGQFTGSHIEKPGLFARLRTFFS